MAVANTLLHLYQKHYCVGSMVSQYDAGLCYQTSRTFDKAKETAPKTPLHSVV
jgi:hypothetical protein